LGLDTIAAINQLRRERGCGVVLQHLAELTAATRKHSRDMATDHFFAHRGSDSSERISRAQAAKIVNYRMNLDEIHRSQILDRTYNDT
jgi:uncharacterized protein YkwD